MLKTSITTIGKVVMPRLSSLTYRNTQPIEANKPSQRAKVFIIFSRFLTPSFFCFAGACQRFALPASGRDEIRFESRKNSKPEKCSKMATNPTCRVHALLDPALDLQDSLPLKDLTSFYYSPSTIFISSSVKPYNS